MSTLEKPVLSSASSLDRYRGCLAGALLGDCIGRVFEKVRSPHKHRNIDVEKIVEAVEKHKNAPSPPLPYTDDTAMTHALAESFLRKRKLDLKDVAESFTNKFFEEKEKQRMYAKVKTIFRWWKKVNFSGDLFECSKKQFKGTGSFGNGGGMRAAAIPLAYCEKKEVLEITKLTTQLTHYHVLGYCGAMLQAYAIHLALNSTNPDPIIMMANLIQFCKDELESEKGAEKPYTARLLKANTLLKEENPETAKVTKELKNSVEALDSIPMAIFCALRSMNPIPQVETDNPVERAIVYSISMGGDTDTIATMAGAISGAQFGFASVPQAWLGFCEGSHKMLKLSDDLHKFSHSTLKVTDTEETPPSKRKKLT